MLTDAERIAILRRAGFRRAVIAALLGVTVEQVQQVIVDPNAPSLQLVGALGDVQSALTNGALTVPAAPPAIVAHDYVSDGDTEGIFYALGTDEGAGSFTNPADGPVVATESGILSPWEPPPHATYLTDRDSTVNIFHSSAGGGWAMWDFGTGHAVKVREYTVRSRWDSSLAPPTSWKLQGSDDGAAWTDLDEATPGFTTVDQWRHFACDTVPDNPFRYVRILDTADTYLVLGEVELYGDLYTYP